MFKELKSIDEFLTLKEKHPAVLAYFSTNACSVCKVLKPKVEEMAVDHFPLMELVYVKSDELPDVAAQNSVFTAPTIIVFFEGRESIRKSRSFSVDELQHEISRYYSMVFSD